MAPIHGQTSHGVVAISSPTRQISDDDRARVEEAATVINLPANREIIQVFAKTIVLTAKTTLRILLVCGVFDLKWKPSGHGRYTASAYPRHRPWRAQIPVHNHTVASLAAAEAVLTGARKNLELQYSILEPALLI